MTRPQPPDLARARSLLAAAQRALRTATSDEHLRRVVQLLEGAAARVQSERGRPERERRERARRAQATTDGERNGDAHSD